MWNRKSLHLRAWNIGLPILLIGGCGDSTTEPQASVSTVVVSLSTGDLVVGENGQATAAALTAQGSSVTSMSPRWTSSNTSVATIQSGGRIAAQTPGTTVIRAEIDGIGGSATLVVRPGGVASISLSPTSLTFDVGETGTLMATARDSRGNALPGQGIVWSSQDPTVAVVSSGGHVQAVASGTTQVRASLDGVVGEAPVQVRTVPVATVLVSPAGASMGVGDVVGYTAIAVDASGNLLSGRAFSWTTSHPSVATVNAAGQVTAHAPGNAAVMATAEGVSGTASATVSQATIASITLSHSSLVMNVGDVRMLVATVRDAAGNILKNRDVSWTSSNLNVVSGSVFGDTAIVTGLTSGTAQVRASAGGHVATTLVSVQGSPPTLCSQISGASIIGSDGQFLGMFRNQYHAESVLNQYGSYGSPYSSTSTNNTYGQYGSPYSSLSARNPYTSTPPRIVKNGEAIAYYSVNSYLSPRVSPDYALTCNFP
jgi:trimeric autotransporter adhesin